MAKTRHGLYAVVHDATAIPGVFRVGWQTNTKTGGEPTAAELSPRNRLILGQEPKLSFATRALATALGLCGTSGSDISDLTAGLIGYQHKFQRGGSRATGSTHRKITVVDGMLYPTRITCAHQGLAELEYEAAAAWDGTNDPFQIAEASALPSAPTDAERFTIGGVQIGGVALTDIINVDIDLGLTVTAEGADSDLWPTHVSLEQFNPKITFRGKKAEWWAAAGIPLVGKAATHANSIVYLRKRTQTGFETDVTAEHIKFTIDGLAYLTDLFNADGTKSGETGLVVEGEFDGTNDALTIDTASAIT